MYANVFFLMNCLHSAVSLTLVREQPFIKIIIIIIIIKTERDIKEEILTRKRHKTGDRRIIKEETERRDIED